MSETEAAVCPFLVPVTVDWLWLSPVAGYCRQGGGRVRVPARQTVARVCATPAHVACPGYRASAPPPARVAGAGADGGRQR